MLCPVSWSAVQEPQGDLHGITKKTEGVRFLEGTGTEKQFVPVVVGKE